MPTPNPEQVTDPGPKPVTPSTRNKDMVERPAHYTHAENGVECIDAIRAALGRDGFIAFLRGQVIRYQWRIGHKDNDAQDAGKARWYAAKLEEVLKEKEGMDQLCDRLQSHRTRQKEWHKGADDVTHLNPLEALKCRHSI